MFGQREYSREEKAECVNEFKASGMSQSAYAEYKNIPKSTFKAWVKDANTNAIFGEVNLGNEKSNSSEQKITLKKTMLFSGSNIRIELKEGYDKEFLRNIIEVMNNAN